MSFSAARAARAAAARRGRLNRAAHAYHLLVATAPLCTPARTLPLLCALLAPPSSTSDATIPAIQSSEPCAVLMLALAQCDKLHLFSSVYSFLADPTSKPSSVDPTSKPSSSKDEVEEGEDVVLSEEALQEARLAAGEAWDVILALRGPHSMGAAHACAGGGNYRTMAFLGMLARALDQDPVASTLDPVDARGWTPLHFAAASDAARVLWASHQIRPLGATRRDSHGCTPAHLAAASRAPRALRAALAADPHLANAPDSNKMTPLHVACALGDSTAVALLLYAGASLDAADVRGRTPPILAAASSDEATLAVLALATSPPLAPYTPNLVDRSTEFITIRWTKNPAEAVVNNAAKAIGPVITPMWNPPLRPEPQDDEKASNLLHKAVNHLLAPLVPPPTAYEVEMLLGEKPHDRASKPTRIQINLADPKDIETKICKTSTTTDPSGTVFLQIYPTKTKVPFRVRIRASTTRGWGPFTKWATFSPLSDEETE